MNSSWRITGTFILLVVGLYPLGVWLLHNKLQVTFDPLITFAAAKAVIASNASEYEPYVYKVSFTQMIKGYIS